MGILLLAGFSAPGGAEPRRSWTLADFEGLLFTGLEGYRDFSNGKSNFEAARCGECHRLGNFGARSGDDLARMVRLTGPRELLGKMLEPDHGGRGSDRAGSLLDRFEEEDVLDLLAFLHSGADPSHPYFYR